jgi:uncharacterized protein (DUF1501 family)
VALLAGPVSAGRYGEYPSLGKLDEDDNLVATVDFGEYYATLAANWFGVPVTSVLDRAPMALAGIF